MKKKVYPRKREEWRDFTVNHNQKELLIGNWQVMQSWEHPLMKVLAKEVTWNNGDVLEIGFGMGISAKEIVKYGCKSYTVIEAHPEIARMAREWAKTVNVKVKVLEGFWENVTQNLKGKYDGILFDTYPLTKKERSQNHFPFIPIASSLLKKNGIFTYYSDEKLPLRNKHIKLLFANFQEVKLIKVDGLEPFSHCDYWEHDYMIIPVCIKK